MDKKNAMLRKYLVIGFIFLLIGINIFSSNGVLVEDSPSYNQNLETVYNLGDLTFEIKTAYAYQVWPGPESTVKFQLDDPENFTYIAPTQSSNYLMGGTWRCDLGWIACQYNNGILWLINHTTGEMYTIGGGCTCTDISWDDWTQGLYGTFGKNIYKIDTDFGNLKYIGGYDSIRGLAFNNTGTCYGIGGNESNYNLYIISFYPPEEILIGPLINYTSDYLYYINAEFDKDNNILYILTEKGLYICDTETCECTFIGSTYDAELAAFAIPYECYETPPYTKISFDPPEPDGENGWYVNDVNVTLSATDYYTGVNVTYYRLNGGEWKTYDFPFVLSEESEDILIEYYSVGNDGDIESVKSATVNIDKTPPFVNLTWKLIGGNPIDGWEFVFIATVNDNCCDINRVEFYLNGKLQDIVTGPGPTYNWSINLKSLNKIHLIGLVCNTDKAEDYVSFYAILVKALLIKKLYYRISVCASDCAGNNNCNETQPDIPNIIEPGLYLFKDLKLPNNYSGYLGRFFILAKF